MGADGTAWNGMGADACTCLAMYRYTRLEYAQAEDTIQQLLRELMLLREIASRASSLQSSSGSRTADAVAIGNGCHDSTSSTGAPAASSTPSPSSQAISNKRISRSKLLGELHQLRAAKAAAESKRDDLLQRLGALEAEKERAEECQEMISRQTAKLLDDKRQLLNDLGVTMANLLLCAVPQDQQGQTLDRPQCLHGKHQLRWQSLCTTAPIYTWTEYDSSFCTEHGAVLVRG